MISARSSTAPTSSIPRGPKIRSTSVSPSQAFSSQPSGGRSGRIPASTSAASAASASSGRTRKSRSLRLCGAPRAQQATLPASAKSSPSSRSTAAAVLRLLSISSNVDRASPMHTHYPPRQVGSATDRDLAHRRRRRHALPAVARRRGARGIWRPGRRHRPPAPRRRPDHPRPARAGTGPGRGLPRPRRPDLRRLGQPRLALRSDRRDHADPRRGGHHDARTRERDRLHRPHRDRHRRPQGLRRRLPGLTPAGLRRAAGCASSTPRRPPTSPRSTRV